MVDKTAIQYDLIFNTEAAAKDVASLTVQLKTANEQITRMQKQTAGTAAGVARTGRAFGSAGQSIQNASYQVADFAIQVQGGVDATRALGQQLPQLLAGFGALGAVVGAGVAIFGPMIANMSTAVDRTKILEEATKALTDAQETTKKSVADLTEEYGKHAEIIRDIAATKEQLAAAEIATTLRDDAAALAELNANALGAADTFSIVANSLKNFDIRNSVFGQMIEPMDEAAKRAEYLQTKFGLTAEAAKGLAGPVNDFGRALGALDTDGAAAALAEFNKWLQLNNASAEQAIPLLDTLKSRYDALAKIKPPTTASMGFSFTPPSAADTFENNGGEGVVTRQLAAIEEAAKKAADAQRDAERANAKLMRESEAAASKAATEYRSWLDTIERGTTPLERANSQLKEATENFERFNAQMTPEQREQAVAYIDGIQSKIDELNFKEKWDEMSKAIQSTSEPLNSFYEQVRDIGKSIQEELATGLTDAFMAFVEGTKSAEDAFKEFAVSFLKEITAMIVKATILYAIQTALGAAGGGNGFGALMQRFGGVYGNGGAFGGGREIKAFAAGGVVSSPVAFPMAGGRTGLMGEAGPEAIMPLTRRNGRLGVEGSPVNIRVNNYTGAHVNAKRNGDGSIDIDMLERELGARVARGGSPLSKGMESGYGLRRAGR